MLEANELTIFSSHSQSNFNFSLFRLQPCERLILQGLKNSELTRIEQLFKNICDGKEKIQIIGTDSEDSFKNETENLIKKLLTRNIGRKLIQKVLENSVITRLDIMAGENNSLTTSMSTGHMKLFLTKVNDKIAYHPTGKLKSQPTPPIHYARP